jgi:hypothetical protein
MKEMNAPTLAKEYTKSPTGILATTWYPRRGSSTATCPSAPPVTTFPDGICVMSPTAPDPPF